MNKSHHMAMTTPAKVALLAHVHALVLEWFIMESVGRNRLHEEVNDFP